MSNKKLINILEKYKAKGGDEQRFMDKHTENVSVFDGPGVAEIDAAAKFVPTYDRSENNYGNNEGEDEEVYEEIESNDPNYFLSIIDDAIKAVYAESDKEDRDILDEMFATEEGYEEFISMIFEADDEDEDEDETEEMDDEDEDEMDDEDESEEDDEVEMNPTVKEKYKKK